MTPFKRLFTGVYFGRRVFITGASGFKGSWLAEWLVELGATVTGYSLYFPSDPCHYNKIRLSDRIQHIEGDVRDPAALRSAITHAQPEIVFHLAAQPIVRASYDDPVGTFDTNVIGTVNVLEVIRHQASVRAAVMITSDKCYENVEQVPGYVETDRLGGKDPYSASKACAEIVFSAYSRSFFGAPGNPFSVAAGRKLPSMKRDLGALLASARAGNVIGGGDWAKDRVVPDCVRAWAANKPPEIRNPFATRPWQHVLEPLSGYLWLGAKLLQGEVGVHGDSFNFGPPSRVNKTVGELIRELRRCWPGAVAPSITGDSTGKPEAALLRLDCAKAARKLAWKPTLSFRETSEFTARWYHRDLIDPSAAVKTTKRQIAAYGKLAAERGLAWAAR